MAIVVGKDMATSGFSKQWSEHSPLIKNETPQNDIRNPEFVGNSDTLPKDAHEASNGTSSKGRHRKRTYAAMNEDSPFSEMIEQLKQVVVAVTALSHGPINTNELHKIVMNVEGFEEDMLDEAFDHWLMMKRFFHFVNSRYAVGSFSVGKGQKERKHGRRPSNGTSSKGRHRKRTYAAMNEDSPFSEMIEQLKQVVVAVTALSHGPINTNELHKIVMNVEGFEEDMLDEAFDHWLMMKRTRPEKPKTG
nr:hypothetical protein CFP56_12612 [Quercus suber]